MALPSLLLCAPLCYAALCEDEQGEQTMLSHTLQKWAKDSNAKNASCWVNQERDMAQL